MQTAQSSPATRSPDALVSHLLEFTRLYSSVLSGITNEALLPRSGPRSNPLFCLAVRLVQERTRLLGALGPPRQIPWENLFRSGTAICTRGQYPTMGEVDAVWRSASEELIRRIERTSQECFDEPPPCWLESRDGTLRGALSDVSRHEACDIRRMSHLRKCLGFRALLDEHSNRVGRIR